MSGFNDREKDFENKYVHDAKMAFKIEARCSKLFGLWAAEKMGLSGDQAQAYALTVVDANLELPGFDDIVKKVSTDLRAKKIDISDHLLGVEVEKFKQLATHQILTEIPK